MTGRIFRSIWLVALCVFLASLILIMGVIYSYYSQLQLDQLRMQTQLIAQGASHEGLKYFGNLQIQDCHIIWFDEDGTVLYDNDTESVEDEISMDQEEVQEALSSGFGESSRYSSPLLEQSIYCAQKLPDGSILRLSTTQNSVLTLLLGFAQPICLVIAVALVLSIFLAFRLSRRIVEPLNELDLDTPMETSCYEELKPLLGRINTQQLQLKTQSRALQRKENEFDAVTGSMSEGLVLLNSSCRILTINAAARKLLGLTMSSVGSDILSYNKDLSDLLLKALNGEPAEKLLSLQERSYQVDASPVLSDDVVSGVVLLLFDITEKQKAEQLRREFTANVSHELKTPLHSISGYAELMSHGMVRPEDTHHFSGQIYTEAQRMIQLVDDIIRLSQLDEGAGENTAENTALYPMVQEILDSLNVEAQQAQVTVWLKGSPETVRCVPHLLKGLVRNLCDNAIKYNRPGGSVTVTIGSDAQRPYITVEDTGIGIPKEHQGRIFERFYRVDKSHSKAVGGTGLGLSIVKHAAVVLNAELELDSEPGVGTTVTVRLPKQEDL